jgi:ribonuclease-3
LLSDTFEALIGAYYRDSGIEAVRELVEPLFNSVVVADAKDATPETPDNVIGQFQNWAQTNHQQIPDYVVTNESGEDHAKLFTVKVRVNGIMYGEGTGNSKREAKKQAASPRIKTIGSVLAEFPEIH